jgi:predicted lipoprotein with Yx(FWY)xxD motif
MKHVFVTLAAVALMTLLFQSPAPAQGKKGTVTGTVVDTYCLLTMNMGGKAHTKCAATCAKNGSPLAIKEDKTGTLYFAAGEKDMLYASSGLEKYVETRVTASGTIYNKDGVRMIVVDSAKPAK